MISGSCADFVGAMRACGSIASIGLPSELLSKNVGPFSPLLKPKLFLWGLLLGGRSGRSDDIFPMFGKTVAIGCGRSLLVCIARALSLQIEVRYRLVEGRIVQC